jgi:general secretion pathway protein A
MLIELEALLRRRRDEGETTALIVDEAQSLSLELLEEIRLLANIETDEHKLLSVIIAGQPELAARLNESELRQFKQRIALRCELRPLERAETAAYIAGRIRAAGGVGSMVFTREAVGLIHDYSRGIPRTVSVIADNALLGGFAAGQHPVGSAIVREVCKDFDLGGSGGGRAHLSKASAFAADQEPPPAMPPPVAPEARASLVTRPTAPIERPAASRRELQTAPPRVAAPRAEIADPPRARRKFFSFLWG